MFHTQSILSLFHAYFGRNLEEILVNEYTHADHFKKTTNVNDFKIFPALFKCLAYQNFVIFQTVHRLQA